ncbi:hypothetical protein [Pseudomonas helleri]|uniref:Uncharacterized protein n=1 Tax=Pseudomonas helleri TaxID=1608996 RepID=A0A7X2CJC7_9PSED|nr:hypothetical protein [Pseudomonas helleri]MQT97754.1 hypothetical protein [Pseudomonas helleri]MQU33587.1 hypothetical protein [Pseudomonas helleri]
MTSHDSNEKNDLLAALNLPSTVHAQALKLLGAIAQARSAADCNRAADRAEGFGLGLETVKALNPASIEGLYLAFEHTATARFVVLEQ